MNASNVAAILICSMLKLSVSQIPDAIDLQAQTTIQELMWMGILLIQSITGKHWQLNKKIYNSN